MMIQELETSVIMKLGTQTNNDSLTLPAMHYISSNVAILNFTIYLHGAASQYDVYVNEP
jgi:hypothetical protein